MNLLQNNPYRTVGLLVGATAREQERQVRRLKQFVEAEQDPQDDFSFPRLGRFRRTLETLHEASSKLNLDSDKMSAALFWFYNGNQITDEPAFDAIKQGSLDQAINIWSKLTAAAEVTQRNASAHSNLSTLYLSRFSEDANDKEALLEKGISLKLKFLDSDFTKDIKTLATDETFKITKKDLQILFLNQVQHEIEKHRGITAHKFLDIIARQEFSAKEDFLRDFVQKPIREIEKKIEEAKAKRKANKANAIKAANSLVAEVKELMNQLKKELGTSNIKYSSIADKVAMELFACGRDYFMHYKETSTNPGEASMKVFKYAKNCAVGNMVKQQIDENIENLQEWIDDQPERDKQTKVQTDFEALVAILEQFKEKPDTIENAKLLIKRCKPTLANISAILGSSDTLYLKLSTRVASQAQYCIVEEINKTQSYIASNSGTLPSQYYIEILKTKLEEAWACIMLLGALDMEQDFKTNRYNANKEVLKRICNQLGVRTPSHQHPTTPALPSHPL